MMTADTIYAQSSGFGKAGIAVVRVSGGRAGDVLYGLSGNLPKPHRASLRTIKDPKSGEILDQALVIWFPGPDSATGEDVAEFHLHGSSSVISAVFRALSSYRNVRPAEAGEFTRRAFANGCIDLVEVEGLADLLEARTAKQRQQALHHLLGGASSVYEGWRRRLTEVLAHVEAAVDFVEEDGVAARALRDVGEAVESLVKDMSSAVALAEKARLVREGITVVLAGLPNTGKSSLLNRLARREAAIVSSLPGTTRDVIEVTLEIEGMAVMLADTAGLREHSSDEIEKIGMKRTRAAASEADILVWVSSPDVAGSCSPYEELSPALCILNKADLLSVDDGHEAREQLTVSTITGKGIPELVGRLGQIIRERYVSSESPIAVRDRHRQAILESIRYLNDSRRHDPKNLELAAEDLRKAAQTLGRVTGRIDVEDLLTTIFSEFCIGK